MKKIYCILLLLCSIYYANAQDWHKIDSLDSVSRHKADIVLSYFDTIQGKKLLYSLRDKDYYIIIEDCNKIREFNIKIDNDCNVIYLCKAKDAYDDYMSKYGEEYAKYSKRKKRKILARFEKDKETVKNAFDLRQYHVGYITRWVNTKWTAGIPSYFVVKDINGRRYGELSSITAPCPINPNLWIYLFRKLSEQIE
jgi:hypothetical protein